MRQPRRHIGVIAAALVAAVLTCVLGAGLASAQQAVPESPTTSFNEAASAVAWTGVGWDAPVDGGSSALEADEREDAIVAELPPDPPEPQDEPEQPDEPQDEPEQPNEPQQDPPDEPEPPKEPEQNEPQPEDPTEQQDNPDEDRPKQQDDEGDPVTRPEGQQPGDNGDGDDNGDQVAPPSKDPSPDDPQPTFPDDPEPEPDDPDPEPDNPDPEPDNPDPEPDDPDPEPDNPDPEPIDPEPEPSDPEPQTVIYDDEGEGDDPDTPSAPSDDNDDTGDGALLPDPDPIQEPEQEPDPDEGKYPIIQTDLKDGEVIGQDWRTFTVRATDYAGRTLMTDNVRVTVATDGGDPSRLYATGDDGYEIRYRLPVDGANVTVSIRATDAKRRASVLDLTVHRAEEDVAEVVDGSITLTLEAGTVGLGRLLGPIEVEFFEGEQMSSVLVRALSENGFGAIYKGSVERSFYLQHVTRAGITDGWEIPSRLMEHLEEVGFTPSDYHEDSLGEFDFTGTSGWMYSVNDVLMSTNMSNYYPADGDEVRIRFTLYRGSDIGGDDGPQWDEEW